jgi:hypothetical protein
VAAWVLAGILLSGSGMKVFLLALAAISLGTPAHARLGETREQAEARYGLPKSEKRPSYQAPLIEGAREIVFLYQGFRIRCALLPATDGKEYIVREEYMRDGGLPQIKDFERDAILAGEGNGMEWSEAKMGPLSLDPVKALQNQFAHALAGQYWRRTDGALAVHGIGGFPVRLELPQAAKWEAQIKAAKDQAARANVPKF